MVKKKIYSFPVSWEVYDRVEIKATSEAEARKILEDNLDLIPLGTTPDYIDGSYKIDEEGLTHEKDHFSGRYPKIDESVLRGWKKC